MGLLRRRKPPPPQRWRADHLLRLRPARLARCASRSSSPPPKFYGADTLLLGGDISAKIVVPIVSTGTAPVRGAVPRQGRSSTTRTVDDFEQRAANSGLYTERMEPDEYQHYADHPEQVEDLFDRVMRRTVQRWVEYAKTRLDGSPVVIYNAPGNDDPLAVDEVLLTHGEERLRFVEGEIVELAPGMEMLSTGYTNPTPVGHPPRVQRGRDPRAPRRR